MTDIISAQPCLRVHQESTSHQRSRGRRRPSGGSSLPPPLQTTPAAWLGVGKGEGEMTQRGLRPGWATGSLCRVPLKAEFGSMQWCLKSWPQLPQGWQSCPSSTEPKGRLCLMHSFHRSVEPLIPKCSAG